MTGARREVGAAVAVVLCSGLTVWGSFQPWASIAGFDPVSASGVAMGEGVVTAMLGLVVALVGTAAVRHGGRTDFRLVAVLFATTAFLIAIVDIATLQLAVRTTRAGDAFGPRLGLYLTAVAAAGTAVAALRLSDAPAPEVARRTATLLVVTAGWCLWAIAATSGPAPTNARFAVVVVTIIGIGVAMWPGRLPWSRIRPRSHGVGIVAYGLIASLQQLPLSETLFTLLPVAVVASLVGSALLDLPVRQEEANEPVDSAIERSTSDTGDQTASGHRPT